MPRLVAVLLLASAPAFADDGGAAYWLLDPTPRGALRALSTGDTPYTVDPGHVVLEIHPLDVAWAFADDGSASRTADIAQTIAKLGVTERTDVQVAFCPFHSVLVSDDQGDRLDASAGDTTLRVRVNLWGDDGGGTALGVIPFVSLPTAGDLGVGGTWGGVMVPASFAVPYDTTLTAVVAGALSPDDDGALQPSAALIATLSRAIYGPLGVWAESTASARAGDGVSFETHDGLSLALGDDVELDLGCHVALPDPNDNINPYLNVALRR